MTKVFSKNTIKILRKAGWYKGRQIEIGKWEKEMEDLEFTVTESARAFMREFGNLTVRRSEHDMAFTTVFSELHSWRYEVGKLAAHMNTNLNPVADTPVGVILIDPDNAIMETDCTSALYLVGNTIYEGVENLLGSYPNVKQKLLNMDQLFNIIPPPNWP